MNVSRAEFERVRADYQRRLRESQDPTDADADVDAEASRRRTLHLTPHGTSRARMPRPS